MGRADVGGGGGVGGRPGWVDQGRVPCLDGLRAVSVLGVMYFHVGIHSGERWPGWARSVADFASLGVDVFFVISGFLITLLLVREQGRTGRVSLGGFYLRRTLRIVPAYACFVILTGLALWRTSSRLDAKTWAALATYTVSIFDPGSMWVHHTWSLSVEEHFYLIWPILFLAVRNRRQLLALCVGYSVLAIPLRMALVRYGLPHQVNLVFFSPVRADSIAVGCAMALVATSPGGGSRAFLRPAAAGLLGVGSLSLLIAAYCARHAHGSRLTNTFHNGGYRFAVEWCIAGVVWAVMCNPLPLLYRALNWGPLVAIGVLSYSLYLWQQPLLVPTHTFWLFKPPCNLLVVAALAVASYYLVEQPFLRLKSRFEPTLEARRRSEDEANRMSGLPALTGETDALPVELPTSVN